MGDCNDKRFEKMRPLYEFDLLCDKDQEDFEKHLMECEACFKSVQEFKEITRNIRYNPKVPEAIEKIVLENEDAERRSKQHETPLLAKSRLKINLVRAFLVIAVLLAILLLKPWHIEFRTSDELMAAENIMAIMYFENNVDTADSANLGEILANLLITDLSESNYIQVISGQRIFDVSRLLGIGELRTMGRTEAARISEYVKAKWMITGNILQVRPKMVVTSQIIDVETGKVIAAQRVSGEEGEDIFSLADKLSAEIKIDLSLPLTAYKEYDRMIADVTTRSLTAYHYYLEGIDHYYSYQIDEAMRCFELAEKYDSAFAMAYYYSSLICQYPQNIDLMKKAVKYSDKVSRKEKYLIGIQEAVLGGKIGLAMSQLAKLIDDYPLEKYPHYLIAAYYNDQLKLTDAVWHLKIAIELDPLYAEAYNLLAYCYINMDEKAKAIEAVQKYAELKPNEINSYDSMADIYAKCGMFDKAIELYHKVLNIQPDFADTRNKLGNLYLFLGELSLADEAYRQSAALRQPEDSPALQLNKSYILLYQGKAEQAIKELDAGISAAQQDSLGRGESGIGGFMKLLKYRILYELGNDELLSMLESLSEIRDDHKSIHYQAYLILYIELLAQKGYYDKAEIALNKLAEYLKASEKTMHSYWYCRGFVEFVKKDYDKSLAYFLDAALMNTDYQVNFMLSQVLSQLERFDDAASIYEKLTNDYRLWNPYWSWLRAISFHHLGLAYEKMGQMDRAMEQYEEFLRIWKDADSRLKQKYGYDDIRSRINQIKN